MGLGVAASGADRAVVSLEGWLSGALVLGVGVGTDAAGAGVELMPESDLWQRMWPRR